MLADRPGVVARTGINEAEYHTFRSEGLGDAADFRRVAIRDRTVGAGEQKDDGFGPGRRLQGVERRAGERLDEHGEQRQEEHRIDGTQKRAQG